MKRDNIRKKQKVIDYYSRLGSRLGYRFLMKKSQHFGIYDEAHRSESAAQQNFSRQFTALVHPESGMKLLDAGCGQGVLAVHMAQISGVHVTGVTIVPLEVKKSLALARQAGVSATTDFQVGDYHSLPFPDNTFDRVYAVETLSHAYELETAVQELYRVLKPGGLFVAAEYEFDFESKGYADLINEVAEYAERYASIHAVREFSKGNFLRMLKKTGYTHVKVLDWTDRLMPSFRRIKRIGRPYKKIVNALGLQAAHPNTIASSFYEDGAAAGVFRYKIYIARKDSV